MAEVITRYSPEIMYGASNEELAELLCFGLAVNQPATVGNILTRALEMAQTLSGCDEASLVLVDMRRNQIEREASTGDVALDRRVSRAGGATRWALDNDGPLIVADTRSDRFEGSPMSPENNIGAYVGVGVRKEDNVSGVLFAIWREPHQPSDTTIGLLRTLADFAATALYGAQLVESLRELNEYMSGILQVAAHDLRSPLGTAIGTLHMFSDELLRDQTSDQKRALQILGSSLGRMQDLVEGILNYERWSGEGDGDWKPHDLNAIARKVVEDFQQAAEEQSQQLKFEPAEGPLVIVADEPLLREAVGNLVSNANKYTPAGGRIILRTLATRPEFELSVEDDGPGIAAEDQEKLFLPFVRLRESRHMSGSGLGLSLVRKIAERHGGSVGVESELGHGSRFLLRVPEMTL